MQIKIHLSDCARESTENVVQKILAASNTRQNEIKIMQNQHGEEWMYFQVSSMSYCKMVQQTSEHHLNKQHQWSLCSVDKFKLQCLYLIKYLLVNLYLILKHGWTLISTLCISMQCTQWLVENCCTEYALHCRQWISILWLKCDLLLLYHSHSPHTAIIEASLNKNLMMDKDYMMILFSTHFTPHQNMFRSPHFSTTKRKFYKILLNLFYVNFNSSNKTRHQIQRYQQHSSFNSNDSCNSICDLSTNDKKGIIFLYFEIITELIYLKKNKCDGIEHHRWHVVKPSSLTTEKLRYGLKRLNSFFYGILLIQRHLTCKHHEFSSDNHHHERIGDSVKHQILLAHNQIILHVTISSCFTHHHHHHRQHHLTLLLVFYSFYSMDNCHATTISIENDISTLGTSNHKLKVSSQNDNDIQQQQHRRKHENIKEQQNQRNHKSDEGSVKYSNCFPHLHRPAFRSNDGVKSHLNAILFLVILCIPLLTSTAASSIHNLKYSTNVVKTKYGPLRGIILRQNPTIEGYLGVPYGEIS